ncbi:MAG: HlyD family secretion protein [Pseudomonadota bacterium]
MRRFFAALASLGRFFLTALFVAAGLIAAYWLWIYYQYDPWTRDGRVRLDVAEVAPDISGLVTDVFAKDNMPVHKGQPLFVIDRPRFELALQQADAAVQQANANVLAAEANVEAQSTALAQARREDARNHRLGNLVPTETVEEGRAKVDQLAAAVAQAEAAVAQARAAQGLAIASRGTARLNLDRTLIRAPVDGVTADVQLRPGDYLAAGHPAFGVADSASLHVDGYLEETKLRDIRVGDPVSIQLMGDDRFLKGHVESIAPGIQDRERSPSADLLANVNPTFNWVRLAQRIPVRIHIDEAPPDIKLIAGRTATVIVHPTKRRSGFRWLWPW